MDQGHLQFQDRGTQGGSYGDKGTAGLSAGGKGGDLEASDFISGGILLFAVLFVGILWSLWPKGLDPWARFRLAWAAIFAMLAAAAIANTVTSVAMPFFVGGYEWKSGALTILWDTILVVGLLVMAWGLRSWSSVAHPDKARK